MEGLRRWWNGGDQRYEPLHDGSSERDEHDADTIRAPDFSYIEYSIFLLLGVSMLWSWNMMLAAAEYFQSRFHGNRWMLDHFQAAEISVSTVTNLSIMLILTRLQANASYPKRIVSSLCINSVIFTLLAISTTISTSPEAYFGFLMAVIFGASLSTGLCQNGIFAFASGFGQPKYTQGIMTGQAVAGVLPCIVQIIAVLSARAHEEPRKGNSDAIPPPQAHPAAALAYFLTATAIAISTLLALFYLLARRRNRQAGTVTANSTDELSEESHERKSIPLLHLFRKLIWLATAVFVTFCVTMVFPVFTQRIVSVRPPQDQPALLQPPSFIPLAFLFWNAGDLIGRLLTAVPSLSLVLRPRLVFVLAISRLVFVGLYQLCNIRGQGAIVESDFFYLVVVQLLFGLSNGFLGSTCMIGASQWVDPEEREAAGGFMGLCLVGGLTVGSLLSFFAAGV